MSTTKNAHQLRSRAATALMVLVLTTNLLLLLVTPEVNAASGDEALYSTIVLQMPFINGESWTVGGTGSYYGEGYHTNANNDYYATDWNRSNDQGATVLPVAFGTVDDIRAPASSDCELATTGLGCYVRVVHPDGYRTLYAHLSEVYVAVNQKVHTWTVIGRVGNTGGSSNPHLHLRFQRQVSGTYFSQCNTPVPPNNKCPNGENPTWPQGHRPSPMMTTAGLTTLQDATSYVSVNGRVYLTQLRNNYGGDDRISYFFIRNNSNQSQNAVAYYFGENGSPTPKVSDTCVLAPKQECTIYVNQLNRIPSGTLGSAYVNGGEHLSVIVVHESGSKVDAYEGIPAGASVAGIGISTTLHIAGFFNSYYGWNSTLAIQNTGSSSTIATAYLYNNSGTQVGANSVNISSKGSAQLSVTGVDAGSVRVVSNNNQLLSVVVRHDLSGGDSMTYLGAMSRGSSAYVPSLLKNYYGWNSAYQTAETTGGGGTTTASVTYYPGDIAGPGLPLNPYGRQEIYMGAEWRVGNGFNGSALVQRSSGSGLFATAIHHSSASGANGYLAAPAGAKDLYLPVVIKGNSGWDASLIVQNVGTNYVLVTVNFYNSGGALQSSYGPFGLTANQARELYTEIPSGLYGSAWVHSNSEDLFAVVHQARSDGRVFGYNGIP